MMKKFFAGLLVVTGFVAMSPLAAPAAQAQLDQSLIDAILNLVQQIAPDAVDDVRAAFEGTSTGSSNGSTCETMSSYTHTTTLRVGSRGAKVTELQMALNSLGYDVGSADGVFGPMTAAGVRQMQAVEGVTADGIVGPVTGGAIEAATQTTTCPTDGGSTDNGGSDNNGSTGPVVTTGNVTAALAASNPASTAIVAGSGIADLAHFTFSNGTSSEVTVTNLVFNRTGVSTDTTIDNAYLFSAMGSRISNAATVTDGRINFNQPNGIFTIPANSSMTISFRADIEAGTAGQFLGVTLSSYTLQGQSAMATSLAGNIHTIASATIAGFNFNNTTTPSTDITVDAQEGYRLWQNTVSVTNEDVHLHSITFRQVGSADAGDLTNLQFFVRGAQQGATMPSFDSSNHVTFDFSANPIMMPTGSHELKLVGDISGDTANETIEIMIREAADVVVKDSSLGAFVTPEENSTSFATVDTGTLTVEQGSLTFTKTTDSPSGTVVDDASNVVMGRWEVRAFGEPMMIEDLTFGFTTTEAAADPITHLRNGAVFVDGAQVGSTASIAAGGTEYSFGSSFVVNPGTTRIVEIRGDIYDDNGAEGTDSGDTVRLELSAGSGSNVERLSSAGFVTEPGTTIEANTLTIGLGTPNMARDASYSSRTTVAPKTAYKIGDFNLQADSSEGINITGIDIDFTTTGGVADPSRDLTNMYVTVGSFTTPIRSSVSETGNNFSMNVDVPAGQSVEIAVFADVLASVTDGDPTADTLQITDTGAEDGLTVSYTTLQSSTSATIAADGQTITFGSGDLTLELDGSSRTDRIVASNQTVTAARYRFQAVNESYDITEFAVNLDDADAASNVQNAQLFVNGQQVGSNTTFTQAGGTQAQFTALEIPVPANGSTIVEVRLMLADINGTDGTAGANNRVTLDVGASEVADSQGVTASLGSFNGDTDLTGNDMIVFRSIPTVSMLSTPEDEPRNTRDLYRWSVTADQAGDIAVKQFVFELGWNDAGTSTLELGNLELSNAAGDITDNVEILAFDAGAGTTTNVESAFANEDDTHIIVRWNDNLSGVVSAGASETYELSGTFRGFSTAGDSVSLRMVDDALTADAGQASGQLVEVSAGDVSLALTDGAVQIAESQKNFLWSDRSANPHLVGLNGSSDWHNGYKVLNFDLGTVQFTLDN